ncbi:MAG: putative blue pigment (indigoidine) exporter [Micromonosporaceae bacterium]
MSSVEANLRWAAVTAVAPVTWGATYFVTRQFLPADAPLWGGVLRALPAGLLLLLLRRRLPRGSWWWRSLVLGTLNMGAFFALVYLAAQLLATSIASTVMATSSMVIMLIAWLILSERPRLPAVGGAVVGIGGVCLMLLSGAHAVDPVGVLASVAAMLMSSAGYVLAKRWTAHADVISTTSWQLIGGGLVLLPLAAAVEGGPPAPDGPALLGFAYVSVVATAVAFACWFTGLHHLNAATVGLVGLLNPVTGVLLGAGVSGDSLTAQQVAGLVLVLLGVVVGQPATARLFDATLRHVPASDASTTVQRPTARYAESYRSEP